MEKIKTRAADETKGVCKEQSEWKPRRVMHISYEKGQGLCLRLISRWEEKWLDSTVNAHGKRNALSLDCDIRTDLRCLLSEKETAVLSKVTGFVSGRDCRVV